MGIKALNGTANKLPPHIHTIRPESEKDLS